MKASILDLRRRMKDVLLALDRNESVTIFYRGKRRCCMNPIADMVLACCLFVKCFFLFDTIRVCPNGSFD